MKLEGINDTYQGLLGLDRLPKEIKNFNWAACLVLAVFASLYGYFHAQEVIAPNLPIGSYFGLLALLSPICIAVAWLRLTGVKWRQALLLFIYVPVAVFVIRSVLGILFMLLYGLMGD